MQLEPIIKSSIVVRPCYEADMEVFRPERPRYIGEIYISGKKVFSTSDVDCEHEAFLRCAKHIFNYEKEKNKSFFLNAT